MSLSTFWSNAQTTAASSYASLTGAQMAATTTPSAFDAWSVSAQIAFVKANGTGSPQALVIGPVGNQILATVTSQNDLIKNQVPASFGQQPVTLDFPTFSSWSQDLQSFYVQEHGTGTPVSLNLGYNATAFTAQIGTGGAVTTTLSTALQNAQTAADQTSLNLAPAAMTPALFFAMSTQDQYNYLKKNGTYVFLSGTTLPVLIEPVTYNGATAYAYLPSSAYGISYSSPALSGSTAGQTFASMPPEVQSTYVDSNGGSSYPKSVTFSDPSPDGISALLPSSGGQLQVANNPPGYAGYSSSKLPSLETFSSWPEASQVAFVKANGGSPLTLGKVTVTLTSSTVPVSFSTVAAPNAAPSSVDPNAFGMWSSTDQQTFFNANAAGTPPTVTIGTGAGATLLLKKNSVLTPLAYPASFSSTPAALNANDFLSWDPAFRSLYLQQNGTGTPRSVTIGGQLKAFASPVDGSLQITTTALGVTPGQNASTLPYDFLPGSAVGTTSAVNQATATRLFPNFDGSSTATTATPLPATFSAAPADLAPSDFGSWNSSQQIAYIHAHIGSAQSLQIGANTGYTIDVFLSAPVTPQLLDPKVYIAQNLQKQDIAKMALADQITLANIPAFQTVAASLGLIPDGQIASNPATALNVVAALFTTAINHVNSAQVTVNGALANSNMSAADKKVFTDEINLVQSQLQGSAIFSVKDIQDKITAIQKRFDRADAFAYSVNNNPGAASLDNGAAITSGYQTFMTQEKTILNLANRANQLSLTGVQAGTQQNLDVPNLVFLFQLYTNLTGEALIRADTEEVNQTNALLQLYSQMQNIINQTVGSFGTDNTQKRPLQGSSGVKDNNGNTFLTAQEIAVVKLFSNDNGNKPPPNPIEIINNMSRTTSDTGPYFTSTSSPKDNNTSGSNEDDQLSTHWSNFGTSLSDTVNTLNQGTQLKMNNIDSETKQKDRNFDLANTALSKMSDIIQQIGNTIN